MDLETGERWQWRDTVLAEPNGLYSYIFWAPFRAEYDRRYRVEVFRSSDGARSFAEVRVPDSICVRVGDDSNARSVQVLVTGEGVRALKAEVEYVLNNLAPGCTVLRNRFSYEGSERPFGNGWQLDVNLVTNRFDMLFECGGITVVPLGYCPPYMGISRIELHLLVGDDTWDPPGGILDPHILSLPTTMTNVENGYGFVGAGYRTVETFMPSDETLQKACFAYEQ